MLPPPLSIPYQTCIPVRGGGWSRKGRKRKSATDDGSGLVDASGRPRISFAIVR
jgi:hypothetical protein